MESTSNEGKEQSSSINSNGTAKTNGSQRDGKSNEYTPEEYLLASMKRFKKEETSNQNAVERLAESLASPFKISEKPCEKERAEVLRCYQQLLATVPRSTNNNNNNNNNNNDINNNSSTLEENGIIKEDDKLKSTIGKLPDKLSVNDVIGLPLFKCYEFCQKYDQCINVDVVQAHYTQTARELLRPSNNDNNNKQDAHEEQSTK